MKVLTYNIQAGLGIDGVRDAARSAELIRKLGADIAGIQEAELGSPRSGFRNQPERLAKVSGMHHAFAHGFQRGPWRFGNCVLSRYPIVSSTRHPLPSTGEQRSVAAARIQHSNAEGGVLHFLCTHLGLDQAERIEQAREISRVVNSLEGPLILVGDFNDFPDSPPVQTLLAGCRLIDVSGEEPTYPANAPTAKIDFIFVRGLRPEGASRVIQTPFSDHLPVAADIGVESL